MAYVYQHIRLDRNEVFYVGIGSDSRNQRAFNKLNRTKFWKSVLAKTEIKVEILKENISWDDACKLEKQLIKKYGRKDLGLGTLVNLTDGGDGANGCKRTDEHKKILSERMKGKKLSLGIKRTAEHKNKISQQMKGKRYALGLKRTDEHKRKISEGVKNAHLEKMYDLDYYRATLLLGE